MRTLLKHTVRTAVEVGLVDLAVQALDGTEGCSERRRGQDLSA